MTRITHKVADAFIRKFNKHFAIKNYSNMKLDAKIKPIDSHTQRVGGQPRQEWTARQRAAFTHKRSTRKRRNTDAEDLVALMGRKR